ncbi:MAG: hypothetical protein J2P37_29625, partial [Ktedonobacteraceae bacterium]|nr:hypothetical protein [Ktedonobacteraceae bacterium]
MQGDRPGKGLSNQGDGEHHLIDRIDALIREYSPPDVPQSPEDVHQKAQQQIETDYHQAKQKI